MKPASVGRFPRGLSCLLFLVLLGSYAASQSGLQFSSDTPPSVDACCAKSTPAYLGAYLSDGKFRPASAASYREKKAVPWGTGNPVAAGLRPGEVPGFVNLHPLERVIENYQPPARAKRAVRRRFFFSALRDDVIMLVYGRERALLTPQYVSADSQGRVIVSDPGASAVHVLDGQNSFRIQAGADRRLHMAGRVAVDAEDNIYVADPDRGVIVVFDRGGNYLRDIGTIGNESMFHAPTAIAIDRPSGRMYVVDTPRNSLFMLDLKGNILQRLGKLRGHSIGRHATVTTPMDLDGPTEIAVGNGRVAVLDAGGSRIRIMNLECAMLKEFNIRVRNGRQTGSLLGLSMDSSGNLYLSDPMESRVKVYDDEGHLQNSLGHVGSAVGEFSSPSGLWIDTIDRIYIADTNNRRVQIFQLRAHSAAGGAH